MTTERFTYNKHPLTGNYVIKDKENKIILPSTTSEAQARNVSRFLNQQEKRIHELDAKAASWKNTAGEQLHEASKYYAKLEAIKKYINDKITETEKDLEVSVRGGAPTGIIHAELDLLYTLEEKLS